MGRYPKRLPKALSNSVDQIRKVLSYMGCDHRQNTMYILCTYIDKILCTYIDTPSTCVYPLPLLVYLPSLLVYPLHIGVCDHHQNTMYICPPPQIYSRHTLKGRRQEIKGQVNWVVLDSFGRKGEKRELNT